MELKTSSRPPLTPMNTPNDFFRVIGSFSMTAASSRTKIGTAVAMMEASTGEELFSPTIEHPIDPHLAKGAYKKHPASLSTADLFFYREERHDPEHHTGES